MRGEINFPKWDGTEACANLGEGLFYDEDTRKQNEARKNLLFLKELCSQCVRLDECREYAIKHEYYGFWGGMSMTDRRIYRAKHKIKLLRPEQHSGFASLYERRETDDSIITATDTGSF